jgi:hypothetical protein
LFLCRSLDTLNAQEVGRVPDSSKGAAQLMGKHCPKLVFSASSP